MFNFTTSHKAATGVRTWSRTRKTVVAAISLALVGALVAVALILFRAPIVGSLNVPTVDPDAVEWYAVSEPPPGTPATCTAGEAAGTLMVNMDGAPGEFCEIAQASARVVGGNHELVVQDLVYTDQTTVGFLSTYGNPIPCGLPVDEAGRTVSFRITVDDDVSAGTYPATTEAGLVLVDAASYVDANCPRA